MHVLDSLKNVSISWFPIHILPFSQNVENKNLENGKVGTIGRSRSIGSPEKRQLSCVELDDKKLA